MLQNLSDKWTGGIDLHGMVAANAFSFTLIGGSQRPYDKNERTMQFVEQAWADAERAPARGRRIIKPNDAPDQCCGVAGCPHRRDQPAARCDQRSYGVQYGTIWDTIEYTAQVRSATGSTRPIGLNADGIDNEMSLSHLGNCGTGTCYVPDFEQLHVDGNKSLIYAMLNFSLQPPPSQFDVGGNVGLLRQPAAPGRPRDRGPAGARRRRVAPADLSGTAAQHAGGTTVLAEFTVDNAAGEHLHRRHRRRGALAPTPTVHSAGCGHHAFGAAAPDAETGEWKTHADA